MAKRKTTGTRTTAATKTTKSATAKSSPKATQQAAKSTSVKKNSAKSTKARKAEVQNKFTNLKNTAQKPHAVSSEARMHMIAEAAYYFSINNGDQSNEVENWLLAEAQIDQQITASI